MRADSATILIEKLQVFAHIGFFEKERTDGQIVIVDVQCALATPGIIGDNIDCTVNYGPLANEIRLIGKTGSRKLLEAFAVEIAELCFTRLAVSHVTVEVRKPKKVPGCDAVGVRRTFSRN